MSFSGTPLGQGRRLDHQTFLGKPPSNGNRPPSPQRLIPAPYQYGAPTLGPRSPTKPTSPVRPHNTSTNEEEDENDPALARFARIKQREQALLSRPGGPKIITSPPKPEKWDVRDTTVNIATAFTQAASDMHSVTNPNNSWASGSSRPNTAVPRSTSVEYESQIQSAPASRRLAAPPGRTAIPRSAVARKPLSKSGSSLHVPDSEGEEDRNTRQKSPFGDILDSAKRLLGPATYYLQQRTSEPGEPPLEETQPSTNGNDPSYDYADEEREFQASQQTRRANNATHTHRRNRMSTDNKAYKPSASDVDEDEEFLDDEKGKRRKKKKRKEPVGVVNTLPSLTYDKRKKRKGKESKGNVAGVEESEGEGSESDDQATDKSTHLDPSIPRSSIPPSSRHSLPRQSVPRGSIPPDLLHNDVPNTSLDSEQRLDSIPEVDEAQLKPESSQSRHRRRSTSRPPSSRIGGPLGSLVHLIMQATRWLLVHCLSTATYFLGLIFGTVFSLFTTRPRRMLSEARRFGLFASLPKYFFLALTISMAWYFLQDPVWHHMPHWSTGHVYSAPDAPAANIAELVARLQRIENVLSGISLDAEKGKVRAEHEGKSHLEFVGRLGALENKVMAESKKAAESEMQYRSAAREGLNVVKQEMEALQAQVQHQQLQQRHQEKNDAIGSDEEARAKLKALEERVGSMEGGVKEALELGKKAGTGYAWWNKLASGSASKAGLIIKSPDGQDVSGLIGHLVDSAVSMYSKDTVARPDFALHTNGAWIIPKLTSPTYEIRPTTLPGRIIGSLSGSTYPVGRSPLTALHHELHPGYCWPFPGSEGQLALSLAEPVYITDVTIDHVAKDVALDMRTAPREMELWGLVEGKDNIAKVSGWMAEKARRMEEAKERGEEMEEEEYPKTLPKSPQYVRVAHFSYDIHAPNNVQTFPILPEIRDLGVDFGVVALRVKNNWGRKELTCLYRLRVHGGRLGETPPPYSEGTA